MGASLTVSQRHWVEIAAQHAEPQPLVEQFLALYPELPHRVLDALALLEQGRIELFRHGETVGAVITEPEREGGPASSCILQQEHCHCSEAHVQGD